MREHLHLTLAAVALLNLTAISQAVAGRWQAPFESGSDYRATGDSAITLPQALELVSRNNPALRSIEYRIASARYEIDQAGLYPNPELEAELEDILWDAPGLKEPEMTIKLSQELELFGRRGARKSLARAGMESTRWEATSNAFDLYLETKRRFHTLAHAQRRNRLLEDQVQLAQAVAENIEFRIEKGAGLRSELLLAQLELSRIELDLSESQQDLRVAQSSLVSLWGGELGNVSILTGNEPDLAGLLDRLDDSDISVDSTRGLLSLNRRAEILGAERSMAAARARPSLTLSGGFRRLEAEGSNTLLFGVSLPLPVWDRNQGALKSIEAEHKAVEYDMRQAAIQARADIEAAMIHLHQLDKRHRTVDQQLLPTAESVYQTLEEDYQAGRLPYTSLLEAERALLELRQEHADLLLQIQQQVINLEYVTGLVLTTEPSRGPMP